MPGSVKPIVGHVQEEKREQVGPDTVVGKLDYFPVAKHVFVTRVGYFSHQKAVCITKN